MIIPAYSSTLYFPRMIHAMQAAEDPSEQFDGFVFSLSVSKDDSPFFAPLQVTTISFL